MMVTGETAQPDLLAQLKFIGYPWAITQASAFGTPPDLFGRYSLGLDYTGQPVYEVLNDRNEANNTLPRPLLTDSPYELNLSGAKRRDQWANSSQTNAAQEFTQSLTQSDDAPFSPTDLEKVLRAWDADSGTLPSRLWDCVNDFDPLKLMNYDPFRVQATSQAAFGSASQPELLTTAQQMASINRRLVTTDGYSMPVVGRQMPSYIPELGADGKPGVAGVDDDNNGIVDDASEIGAPLSDDFQALTGTKYSEGTIVDVLRYRIQRERIKNGLAPFDLTNLDPTVLLSKPKFDDLTSRLAFQELAPELVAGLRMDVNRPFGDGVDNDGNGVVDDPLEAGEPFLDVNGNGKMDYDTSGKELEPFIDLDGSKSYTLPLDQLWSALTASGVLAEPITFDYTNGVAVPVYKGAIAGGVRNLESQGRQQLARNLYCLMLLLVDENYIAPWDENDPQVLTWMENEKKKLTSAMPPVSAAQADLIVKRKNTCRQIAQWAINCVDMRDSDVIMTPFEYDENPWDGWGTLDNADPANPILIPLDGDPLTDENKGEMIDWANIPTAGGPKTIKTLPATEAPTPLNQTRGVVWGAERPELLITETLAFHDRRTEDLASSNVNGHDVMGGTSNTRYEDEDLDQSLRPRGSVFFEVENPWSEQGQYPGELYSQLIRDPNNTVPVKLAPSKGVELSRLSTLGVNSSGNLSDLIDPASATTATVKRSPVWRMIVVEDWPEVRNQNDDGDDAHDIKVPSGKLPKSYGPMDALVKAWKPTDPPPYRAPDPDFDTAFDSTFKPSQVAGQANQFRVEYPYVEREFYFTTDNSRRAAHQELDPCADNFKLRIPDRSIKHTVAPIPKDLPGRPARCKRKGLSRPRPRTSSRAPISEMCR